MPIRAPIAPELAALSNAAKARPGYFSVLDELIGKLPNRPLTVEEIRQRLKPNTMLNREGMQFPLKQNEIDYALEPVLGSLANARLFTPGKISPADLRNRVRNTRPEFNSVPTSEGDFSPHDYSQYSTQGPRRLPGHEGYFENITTSPNFGETVNGHFTPDTLHFTRGSRHLIEPTDENQGMQMRLIDEIQNDRANQARVKPGEDTMREHILSPEDQAAYTGYIRQGGSVLDSPEFKALDAKLEQLRNTPNGWQTPEDKAKLDALLAETRIRKRVVAHSPDRYTIADMQGNPFVPSTGIGEYPSRAEAWDALNLEWPGHGTDDMHGRAQIYREEPLARKPQDAPFKDPQDYGRFEMKNQLLDAINQGDDFLGITPSSGPASWFPGTGNKETTYDNVYPGELRKIANQYGAPFSNVPVAINMADPLNLRTLNGTDIHDFLGSTDWDRAEPLYAYRELADELAPHYTPDPAYTSELHFPEGRPTDHLDEVRKHLDLVGRLENDVASGDATIGDHAGAANELQDAMERLYNQVIKQKMFDTGVNATRDIPSMHLTPEVKDRISRIGLPLFTAAGAAALSPELMHSNQSAEPEMQTYSEGGGVSRFAGILGKLGEDVERGARSGDTQWQRMLADKMAERNAINHPSRRGRSETLGDYGAYMDRRAGNLEAQPAPVRLPPPDTPPAPPVDDSSALQGLTAPNAHAGTGHYDDMSTLERFRQYLGLYEGGSVKRYDTGGPAQAGMAPPANNNLSSWQAPMVAPMANPNTEPTWMTQPQQSILDMSQPNNTGMPQTAQPGQAAPAGGGGAGGVLQSIAKNEIQGGLEGAAMGALNTGTLSGALSGGLSGITGGLAGSTGAAGTGILGSISGGLSAAGSAIGTGLSSAYGALAAMGPVGWVGAAALAAGAVAAASQKKSSALHHYDLKSGSFTQPMKLDGVQLTAQDLNNYFGPAISTFKNTKNATMALANIKPPSTPAEKAMAAHASALFDGTGNPMRQIAKADPSFGTGIWNAGNKDKKAMKEMLAKGQFPTAPKLPSTPEQQRQDEDAMRQAGYNPQQIAAVNSGNNSALAAATKQSQTMATNAAAPREYNPTAAPAAPQVVAGANKNGLLSRIQQQQAARSPG